MENPGTTAGGCYRDLGVGAEAGPREIEAAFVAWRAARDAGACAADAYQRAERAYHLLLSPPARARHDRQLGLVPHPAWAGGRAGAVRVALRRALHELARGRAAGARRLLEAASRSAPDDPDALSYLAVACARSGGDLYACLRRAERAAALRPGDPALLFNLAAVCASAGLRRRSLAAAAAGWRRLAASLLRRPECDGGHCAAPAAGVRSPGMRARAGPAGRRGDRDEGAASPPGRGRG